MPPIRTRIPSPEDFAHLEPELKVSLVFPEVPETTTSILILFHGLGDSDVSFASFARNINLPGVLAISVRGVSPLPPAMLGLPPSQSTASLTHFHWGDDLTLSPTTGDLDPDPGFEKVQRLVLEDLIQKTLVATCGWTVNDIVLFGFGQGGSVALGLASRLRSDERVVDVSEGEPATERSFKGLVSIGGPLPTSMIPTLSARDKARSPALICHGRNSEYLDDDAMETLKREFVDVREVKWKKAEDTMPQNREEMMPIMQFLAERLRAW
ncbi:Alpha/Beta hydrolase protein [Xylariaceae sp. FL1272]|nr:Alpha/Beta hydrolase protein [Xylariaceae sp. FL1272]